jgi:hypothetical protein
MSEGIPINIDPAIERRIRRRLIRLFLLAVFIFICGGVVGWGVGILLRRPPPRGGMGPRPEPPVDVMVGQLRDELLLSDDQAKQVRDIYQAREDALKSIREKMEPELKSEYDKLDQQMKKALNSAQYQRWSERFENVRNLMLPPPPRDVNGPGPGERPPPGMEGPGLGGPQGGPPGPHGPPDGMPPP